VRINIKVNRRWHDTPLSDVKSNHLNTLQSPLNKRWARLEEK
jgi:hypothetical protein